MSQQKYYPVIGLEVHVQMNTESKIFCSCPTLFGQEPNSQICPVCAGYPGTLPVLNEKVFEAGVRTTLALEGVVNKIAKFDRKNYFYPDLPKGYQISQFDQPVGLGGVIRIVSSEGPKVIRVHRLHLEEDAGKLMHDGDANKSQVDLNRAGIPLAEIVSEPDVRSPEEAYLYLTQLKAIIKAVGASDADMEKGQLRCDANISLRLSPDAPFGTKVEVKNLNSFKNVRAALEYEIKRQAEILDAGGSIDQETRLWDDAINSTLPMRSKEHAHDYRYFPEPDLVPFEVDSAWVEQIRKSMPELPDAKRIRIQTQYDLSEYDTQILIQTDGWVELFERMNQKYSNAKTLINWLIGPLLSYANEASISTTDLRFDEEKFIQMLTLIDDKKISYKVCKEDVFPDFISTGKDPQEIVASKGLSQISNVSELETVIQSILDQNEKSISDYQSGKANALMFLVGQVMRQTKGKANPNLVKEMLEQKLK